jgi:hypothetical protein
MGLLDEAIREHLELKRRRGADASEVARQEQEALGPASRGPAPLELPPEEDEVAAGAAGMTDGAPDGADGAHGIADGASGGAEPAPGDELHLLPEEPSELAHDELAAPDEPPADYAGEPTQAFSVLDEVAATEPEGYEAPAAPAHEEAGSLLYEEEEYADEPPAPSEERPSPTHEEPPPETHEEPTTRTHEQPPAGGEPAPAPPDTGEHDDVLEETPEFLQETPEHDRLWFEQRPPKDFDFDK